MTQIRVHIHLIVPKTQTLRFTKFHNNPSLYSYKTLKSHKISCSNSNPNINNMELEMGLAIEIEKMKTQMLQTQEAMKKSRNLLYAELCLYLGLGKEDLKRKWEKMEENDKLVLVQEFVSDWGINFHPLSVKSVKELVDQNLFHDNDNDDNLSQDSLSSSVLFSGLKKLMGFRDSI